MLTKEQKGKIQAHQWCNSCHLWIVNSTLICLDAVTTALFIWLEWPLLCCKSYAHPIEIKHACAGGTGKWCQLFIDTWSRARHCILEARSLAKAIPTVRQYNLIAIGRTSIKRFDGSNWVLNCLQHFCKYFNIAVEEVFDFQVLWKWTRPSGIHLQLRLWTDFLSPDQIDVSGAALQGPNEGIFDVLLSTKSSLFVNPLLILLLYGTLKCARLGRRHFYWNVER